MANRFIKIKEVSARTALSRSYLYELCKLGKFPKQIKLSERASAWIESEVEDWIEKRIAERDQGVA